MLVQQNQTITLPDHRNLGFAEYGDPNREVVFFYTNSQGYAKDAELLLLDWGIDLKKITMQVQLWWGEQDKTPPPKHSGAFRQAASQKPHPPAGRCRAFRFYECLGPHL